MSPDARPQEASRPPISPESVVAWLVTQPNARGTLYLEHVARSYMWALRTMPAKLDLPPELTSKSIFSCQTPEELNQYWAILKTAPNYQELSDYTRIFSPGMKCFLRYLQFLQTGNAGSTVPENKFSSSFPVPHQERLPLQAQNKIKIPDEVRKILRSVLYKYFTNGFRLNDDIELVRFREFTFQDIGKPINEKITDKTLTQCICSCGPVFHQKVYPVSDETIQHIYELVSQYFANGAQIIFYEQFYESHYTWLYEHCVISSEMLKMLLQEKFGTLVFTATYFGSIQGNIPVAIEDELIRVWGDNVLLTYQQLSERLPYIPLDRIKNALVQSANFVSNGTETYANLRNVHIAEEEKTRIYDEVLKKCTEDGYASLADLSLDDLSESNYELSEAGLQNAVFNLCLSLAFDRKGKIVMRKGEVLNVRAIMEKYCRTQEHCSLDELNGFAEELTGSKPAAQMILEVGNAAMVRTGKDIFVSESLFHFDIPETDRVIANFITGDFAPIQTFTTFAAFPDCGQTWNLFVLETYCRRFSEAFHFDTFTINSSNCGAIISNKRHQSYVSILVDAVLQAGVKITEKEIGEFLTNQGYIARKSVKIKEIVSAAKNLQERQD